MPEDRASTPKPVAHPPPSVAVVDSLEASRLDDRQRDGLRDSATTIVDVTAIRNVVCSQCEEIHGNSKP